MSAPASPADYESFVAESFRRAGCTVEMATSATQEAWDFVIVTPKGRRGAVQVKSRRGSLPLPLFNRLSIYLSGPEGADFDFGVFVVNSQFSKNIITVLAETNPADHDLYIYAAVVSFPGGEINWVEQAPSDIPTAPRPDRTAEGDSGPVPPTNKRIAVFTEKGGVGKTSLAAHLAGAMVYGGQDAVLVDVDGQRNLSLLLGDGLNVATRRGGLYSLIVAPYKDFSELDYKDYYIVYDCAPQFTVNPPEVFERVTDTVIPIVLSPLSILGNAEVIHRTIEQIRAVNPAMRFHIVINQYVTTKTAQRYQTRLLNFIRYHLKQYGFETDPLVRFYEPSEVSVRRSDILLHWGMFLLTPGEEARLAFASQVNGAQNLLADFLALADSLEEAFEEA